MGNHHTTSSVTSVSLVFILLMSSFGICHETPVNLLFMASRRLAFGLFNASTNLGALAYSADKLAELHNIQLSISYRDSNCSSRNAIGEIFDVYQQSTFLPDLILGPICSDAMEPVAMLASYLNRPVLGWISSDPNLSDKSTFTTLIRTLWPIVNLANGVVQLCQLLHWRRVFIISSNNVDEDTLGAAVFSTIESNANFTVTSYVNKVDLSPSISAIEAIFTKVKKEARIVILSIPMAELRNWSLAAYNQEMYSGDYAFIYVNQQTATEDIYTTIANVSFYVTGDSDDVRAQQSLQNFFIVLAKTTSYNETNQFLRNFDYAAHHSNLSMELGIPPATPDFYSLFMYDGVLVYSRFANLTNTTNNGSKIFNAARNSVTLGGATGDIVLDSSGDRMPSYYFFKMGYNKAFDVVAQTEANTLPSGAISWVIEELRPFIWGNGETGIENAPPDEPRCGFENEHCQLALYIATPVAIVAAGVIAVGIYFIQRKLRYEKDLLDMTWRLNFNDIQRQLYAGMGHCSQLNFRAGSMILRKSKTSLAESVIGQAFINVGRYHGTLVALKFIRKTKVKLDRHLMEEMRKMMKLKHSNLNTFMGACTEAPNICCVWEYCSKGSLQDIVYNDSITLDDVFKFSICIDMFRGLAYLHDSHLKVHGRLKSNNVIIDGRWVCKLTDYGLDCLLDGQDDDPNLTEHNLYSQLYWTAPEELRPALRSLNRSRLSQLKCQSPCADIYSAGIIVKEVFCRNGPYSEHETLTPDEVIAKVRAVPEEGGDHFRPLLDELPQNLESGEHVAHHLMAFIEELWAEDPKTRPGARAALTAIAKINPFKSSNVVDNMIRLLEKYSNHLEEVVNARTTQLEEERKNTEQLLYRMLPRSIADKLKIGLDVEPESFDSVTLYFSDISGFQDLAAECSPFQVVDILNGVYGLFDGIIPKHDVYKVETIGDTYVMVSGLPQRNGDMHIAEIANCALDLISGALDFRVPHKPDHKLRMRIGINTGPIVASVVGITMPRYCLFGDTINTTSRMESHGLPMRIHVSPSAKEALSKFAGYYLSERGTVTIKGKGQMTTFWLTGKVGYTSPLPDYEGEFQNDIPIPRRLPTTAGKSVDGKTMRPSIESGYSETISLPDVITMKDGVRISISPNLSDITPIESDM